MTTSFSFRLVVNLMVVLGLLFIWSVSSAEARHDGGSSQYSSAINRAIDNLDDDEVETFPLPVLLGLSLKSITPDFGDPRGGGTRSHEGQDMMAPLGTPIVSPTEAVVTSIGNGASAGKYVYTANPGGESWRYMHLDKIADIKVGDVLKPGDFIGTVGNTGNASGGGAHLHFEIRKGKALDPYPRLQETYELKEKMTLVTRLFREIDDKEEMADFLVTNFLSDFSKAQNSGYSLPKEITAALKARGVVDTSELQKQLAEIITSIPSVVQTKLSIGDTGTSVSLVQIFLIYNGVGPAATYLKQSGATGYFGTITAAALREYQAANDLEETGDYDEATRKEMMSI